MSVSPNQQEAIFPEMSPSKELRRKRNRNGGELADQMETIMASSSGFRESVAKMKMEMGLKNKDLEIRALQAEMREQMLQCKVAKMEQEKHNNEGEASVEHLKEILARIGGMEKQQQQQMVSIDQLKQTQKFAQDFSILQQKNCWDASALHNELSIIGPKALIVHHKGIGNDCRSVIAKQSILNTKFRIFYFEVKVETLKGRVAVGFASKTSPYDTCVRCFDPFSYTYQSDGTLLLNFPPMWEKQMPSFSVGDVVGCGVDLATHQLIFTKNGKRLDGIASLFVSFGLSFDLLFPCAFLCHCGDQIEINFGPNFEFDVDTLF